MKQIQNYGGCEDEVFTLIPKLYSYDEEEYALMESVEDQTRKVVKRSTAAVGLLLLICCVVVLLTVNFDGLNLLSSRPRQDEVTVDFGELNNSTI